MPSNFSRCKTWKRSRRAHTSFRKKIYLNNSSGPATITQLVPPLTLHPTALPAVVLYYVFSQQRYTNTQKQGSLCLLQKAKLLTSREQPFLGKARLQARALTLNNLGCLMKKWGKVREGIKFLARAIRIEAELPGGADNPAGTHVNMSAALSTLGLHRAAAAHAGHAIGLASQAIMRQAAAGSFVHSEEDSITAEGDYVGGSAAGPGGAGEEGESASVDVTTADYAAGTSCGSGSSLTAVIGGAPEGGSSDAPPQLQGPAGGETIDSAAADNGRIAATSSSSSPPPPTITQESSPGTRAEEEKKGVRISAPPTNGAASESASTSAMGETSSTERREALSAAAGGLLAIAYFNLGAEREHLGQLDAALSSYEDARVAADQHLGPESPIAKGIGVALEKASAAAVATASYSRKRAAWRSRSAVSSFPAIGKLQFRQRTPPDGVSSFGGRRRRRRASPRRLQNKQHQHQQRGVETAKDLLDRAYSCARPYPAPPRTDSWSRLGRVVSPRSPPTAPGPESAGGPQRAGRWTTTKPDASSAVTQPAVIAQPSAEGGGRPSPPLPRCGMDEDLRWRALACAEWQCSPREALHAQQTADRRVDVGVVAVPAGGGDHHADG